MWDQFLIRDGTQAPKLGIGVGHWITRILGWSFFVSGFSLDIISPSFHSFLYIEQFNPPKHLFSLTDPQYQHSPHLWRALRCFFKNRFYLHTPNYGMLICPCAKAKTDSLDEQNIPAKKDTIFRPAPQRHGRSSLRSRRIQAPPRTQCAERCRAEPGSRRETGSGQGDSSGEAKGLARPSLRRGKGYASQPCGLNNMALAAPVGGTLWDVARPGDFDFRQVLPAAGGSAFLGDSAPLSIRRPSSPAFLPSDRSPAAPSFLRPGGSASP